MPSLPFETLRSAFAAQPLFEDKTWRLSPEAWPILPAQAQELEAIGAACLEFHQALEALYLRSVSGKNLLRNKPLTAPWVADYLERGKPRPLVEHGRDPRNRGMFPTVLRPDLLLTGDGFVMSELDSVPGGIGLTAFLNRLYRETEGLVGGDDAMVRNFHASLAALRPDIRNPLIALVVSDEAATYRPEMEWLAHQMQVAGQRVFCMRPEDLFPLGGRPLLRCRGQSREDRHHLPLLRAVRPGEHQDGALHLRGVGLGRRRHRPAHALVPGGEAGVRPLPPPPPAGVLVRGPGLPARRSS